MDLESAMQTFAQAWMAANANAYSLKGQQQQHQQQQQQQQQPSDLSVLAMKDSQMEEVEQVHLKLFKVAIHKQGWPIFLSGIGNYDKVKSNKNQWK